MAATQDDIREFASRLRADGDSRGSAPQLQDTVLVFYSNDGRRSLDKASYFRAYGMPHARSLTGGLVAWEKEVGREASFPPAPSETA